MAPLTTIHPTEAKIQRLRCALCRARASGASVFFKFKYYKNGSLKDYIYFCFPCLDHTLHQGTMQNDVDIEEMVEDLKQIRDYCITA